MLPLGSHDIYSRSAWLFHLSSGQLLRIYNLVQRHYSWSNLGGNDSPALAIIIWMYAFNTIFLTELKSHMSEERQIQEEHSIMGTKNSQKFSSLSKCGLAAQMN